MTSIRWTSSFSVPWGVNTKSQYSWNDAMSRLCSRRLIRIDHPEFPRAIGEANLFLLVNFGRRVGGGQDLDDQIGGAADVVFRIGLLESPRGNVGNIGYPQLVFRKRAESHLCVHIASGFLSPFEQLAQVALDKGMFELRSSHTYQFSVP